MRASLPVLMAAGLVAAAAAPRWLRLCDKGANEPVQGSRAWEDAPLRADLLDSLQRMGWTLRAQYRWENLVSAIPPSGTFLLPAGVVDAGPVAVAKRSPVPIGAAARSIAGRSTSVDEFTILLKKIWNALGIDAAQRFLSNAGKTPGLGITIAFMDGHFRKDHPVLSGANIADAHDFVGPGILPWDTAGIDDLHGTQTSGMVASSWSQLPGIAPAARFLLYRTENDASETPVEEDNLAAAIVRADSLGAQVISISLGYRYVTANDDSAMHPWSAFDGRTLVASRAATAAARRDIVVVVAAGNEGGIVGGRSIGSPADADSILVVGAVDTADTRCYFSSWGPTFDGRRKPDVVAPGCNDPIAGLGPDFRMFGAGTSFSTPLVAGMVVLARQMAPGLSSQDLVRAFRASGTMADSPDTAMGWGVPSLQRIRLLQRILSGNKTGSGLPGFWSPSHGPLVFQASSAETLGHLGVELRDVQGRIQFQWEGKWSLGSSIWNPSSQAAPRPGLLFAHWWGDYGEDSHTVLVVP